MIDRNLYRNFLFTIRSQSQYPGRSTSVVSQDKEKSKFTRNDGKITEAKYKKECSGMKEHLNMIVIGHVDAGKSTLMGHILYAIGEVSIAISVESFLLFLIFFLLLDDII